MTAPKIEPALTDEEWAEMTGDDCSLVVERGQLNNTANGQPEPPAKVIALANAALPDSDPRKITREHVDELGYVVSAILPGEIMAGQGEKAAGLEATRASLENLAKALASYLPPVK